MTVRRTRRGELITDGKVNTTAIDAVSGENNEEHRILMRFFEPSFEETLDEVCLEVAEMRYSGKLRPFIEGEPIGAYKRIPRPKPPTAAQVRDYHNRSREFARKEMLELRAENNRRLRGGY